MPRVYRLREFRDLAGLSQSELAELIAVNRNTIQRLETGAVGARPSTLRRLAKVLKVRIGDLITPLPQSEPT